MNKTDSWDDAISHFVITRKYSKNSASVTTYILTSHLRWILEQDISPDAVTAVQFGRYLRHLDTLGRSSNTMSQHFGTLRRYYRWLVDQGIMDTNPTTEFRTPRETMNVRDTFSVTELAALWGGTRNAYERTVIGLLGINALKPNDVTAALVTDLGRMEGHAVLRLPKRTEVHGLPYTVLAPPVLNAITEVVDGRKSGPLLLRANGAASRKSMALVIESVAKRVGITSKVSPLTLSFSMRAIAIEKGFSYTGVIRAAGDVETRRLVKWVHRAPTSVEDHAAIRTARLVLGSGSEALDQLMNARIMLRESDCPPAASVAHAGAILERHLRNLCHQNSVMVTTNNPKIGSYSSALSQKKILNSADVQLIARIQHFRDNAAHGWFEKISREDALWVLRETEQLVVRFPAQGT